MQAQVFYPVDDPLCVHCNQTFNKHFGALHYCYESDAPEDHPVLDQIQPGDMATPQKGPD